MIEVGDKVERFQNGSCDGANEGDTGIVESIEGHDKYNTIRVKLDKNGSIANGVCCNFRIFRGDGIQHKEDKMEMSVDRIKPANLAEAKKQVIDEKKNAEIEEAKRQYSIAVDEIDRLDRDIKYKENLKAEPQKILDKFKRKGD